MSGKHSQQDVRKCADRLNSERKFWKTLASEQTGKILLWPHIVRGRGRELVL